MYLNNNWLVLLDVQGGGAKQIKYSHSSRCSNNLNHLVKWRLWKMLFKNVQQKSDFFFFFWISYGMDCEKLKISILSCSLTSKKWLKSAGINNLGVVGNSPLPLKYQDGFSNISLRSPLASITLWGLIILILTVARNL